LSSSFPFSARSFLRSPPSIKADVSRMSGLWWGSFLLPGFAPFSPFLNEVFLPMASSFLAGASFPAGEPNSRRLLLLDQSFLILFRFFSPFSALSYPHLPFHEPFRRSSNEQENPSAYGAACSLFLAFCLNPSSRTACSPKGKPSSPPGLLPPPRAPQSTPPFITGECLE